MVDNDENILVEFDYQNIVLVDPNKTVDSQGNVKERLLKHENLVYYANLEATLLPRTRLAVNDNGNLDNQKISIATVNFLKPGDSTYLSNEYLDEITGLDSVGGKGINQIIETKDSISSPGKSPSISQTVGNNVDTQLLLISQISVETDLAGFPKVTVEMEDIRGRALFEKGENSPYSVFFNYPYPIFYLTLKGYFGKAIKYQLSLRKFNARFDTGSGNFKITVDFYAYKYNVLTSLQIKHLLALPFMYKQKYKISPTNAAGPQTAQNSIGNTNGDVIERNISKGLQKISEVYSEYKAKGLIPENFPELTVQQLLVRLENLEKNIANSFTLADLSPLTDAENYKNILIEYQKDVFFGKGTSWFYTYMDDKNYFIEKNTGRRIYTFNKFTRDKGLRDTAISKLQGIIETYNKQLSDNKTFGKPGGYDIQGHKNQATIENNIDYNDFIPIPQVKPDDIDYEETYYQRTKKRPNQDITGYTQFRADVQPVLNSIEVDKDLNLTYYWYYFEGKNSFVSQVEIMFNQLAAKVDEIKEVLSKILSERLEKNDGGIGFKPILRNILSVFLASTEAFLRLMCEVHSSAWEQREHKYRVQAILDTNKTVQSVDAKDSVDINGKNLIPIYPWPQYFHETNDDKGERYELAYPGDSKFISKTKGYLYGVWPEVEFVEEYIKGRATIKPENDSGGTSTNEAQSINRISLNSLDFPTSNILFANKQESKFMYEIWERVFLSSNYQRFMKPGTENEISDLIAESEFINIKESLVTDAPYLLQKLKEYGFTNSNFVPYLAHVSNSGKGESWQKYIRDIFVTPYIQQEVENSFVILDNSVVSPGVNIIKPLPAQLDKLKIYLTNTKSNSTDLTDTFPFTGDTSWYQKNMANGSGTSILDIYNTTKTLEVNDDKKMVSNFSPTTKPTEKRPISNFNFYSITTPDVNLVNLKSFYSARTTNVGVKTQLPTEGSVYYNYYSGNVGSVQTTSILNTPYFVNSIQQGVYNWLTGNTNPYVSSAFLYLNSLPLATFREKYKTYSNSTTTDLDYIFATFKKFGAIHKIPYAWILKYGSVWHRYKVWVESGNDILQSSWTNFDGTYNFDPVTNLSTKSYNLTIGGVNQNISFQKTSTAGITTLTEMNVGFYPKVINDFNLFCKGYDLFYNYTDSEIQTQLLSPSGFTLTYTDSSAFDKNAGFDDANPTDNLRFRPWSCTLIDTKNKKQYVVPSFGTNVNQVQVECFKDSGKLLLPVKSNPAVINGSVRTFWSLPNYGYLDNSKIDIPSPYQYMKTVFYSTNSSQESFSLGDKGGYTSMEETFSVFNKEILDMMETEFLKFSKSKYEYEVHQIDDLTENRILIDTLGTDLNSTYKNFQLLMTDLLTVNLETSNNSKEIINNIQSNQLKDATNVIQRFLEYDVVIKYGNPSNFDRRLFDSFSTINYVEDKTTYNPYVANSLPTSGGTTTLSASRTAYPQVWIDLQTYVGFSSISGISYSNNGSTITDFFVDNNIEFTSDSVKALAPLIRIYATQKKVDSKYNKSKFVKAINDYLLNNKKFTDLVFNSLFTKLQKELPNIEVIEDTQQIKALQGEQTALELWESFKGLNDTWIAGYDYSQTTFMEDVLLLDRANRNIGDQVYIDPIKTKNLFSNMNEASSVFSYISSLLGIHHFTCLMHPAYINYYNVQEVQKDNIPKTEGTLEFGNNLFGTFLNVDTRSATPKLVCTYSAVGSEHTDTGKNATNRFRSDSFEIRRASESPLLDNLNGKEDWGLSNKVVAFNVDIGIRNQNIFHHLDISQNLGVETKESLDALNNSINQYNGRGSSTQNASLWNFYKKRSYEAQIQCMGNVMIQPTMYFNLRYVPMFYGPYYITSVKHNITPGKFETTFKGTRQQIFALPKIDNYLQTLTKELLSDISNKLKQGVSTNSTGAVQTNNANSVNSQTSNLQKIDSVTSNCSGKIPSLYSKTLKFSAATQSESRVNIQDMINTIKTNITGGSNPKITKIISFVTIYLNSFNSNGNEFVCWNNNYSGARLNYGPNNSAWPGDKLTAQLKKEFLCQIDTQGESQPYASFENIQNMCKFLEYRWGVKSPSINNSPASMVEGYVRYWNSNLTINEYNVLKNNNIDDYNELYSTVEKALEIANNPTIGFT